MPLLSLLIWVLTLGAILMAINLMPLESWIKSVAYILVGLIMLIYLIQLLIGVGPVMLPVP